MPEKEEAKGPPQKRSCGTMPVHERLLRTDPRYAVARAQSENQASRVRRGLAQVRQGVTVIPVVVHVVHKQAAENISDPQIQSQIDVLNKDFRKTNADAGNVPSAFANLVADARIEFKLAAQDPNGAATSGILRVQTAKDAFTDDDGVKHAASGGSNAWPADRYLNIWVCNLAGGLLGYAQFPGGDMATDGVVILYTAFGTVGAAAAPFNLGRTTTHEVGHWLNLRHIWGDDGDGCNGSDFVNDTPNQAGANYGKPQFPHVTCNNGPHGDLFMNYMDYVDDAAMYLFTPGQVARMQTCLDNDRPHMGTQRPEATLKFKDEGIGVGTTLKFNDDPASLKFRDDIGSLKFRDDPGSLKFRDDVKTQYLDKHPGADVYKPAYSDLLPVGPGPYGELRGTAGGQGAVPLILATPHHSMAWTHSFPSAARATTAAYEAQIVEYESVLASYDDARRAGRLNEIDAKEFESLQAEYAALVEEYRQLTGR